MEIIDNAIAEEEGEMDFPNCRNRGNWLDVLMITSLVRMMPKVLAVAAYNHYKRIDAPVSNDDVELQKSNILLVYPTGTGKTLATQTLSQISPCSFAVADATTLPKPVMGGRCGEHLIKAAPSC